MNFHSACMGIGWTFITINVVELYIYNMGVSTNTGFLPPKSSIKKRVFHEIVHPHHFGGVKTKNI